MAEGGRSLEAVPEDSNAGPADSSIGNSNNNNNKQDVEVDPKPSTRLSHVSSKYDVGQKGYLTPAEQKLRDLDSQDDGFLPNDKVAGIMEQTLALRQANRKLRLWVIGLFVTVVLLGIANIVLAFAAADRARKTDVNDSTGLMTSRESGRSVVVVSTGTKDDFDLVLDEQDGRQKFCTTPSTLARMWNSTLTGTPTNVALWEQTTSVAVDGTLLRTSRGVTLQASGSHLNETHVCLGQAGSVSASGRSLLLCIDFADDFCQRRQGRELASHHTSRALFQAALEGRQLQLHLGGGIFNLPPGSGASGEETVPGYTIEGPPLV